jgi:hypothetical protein
MPGTGTIPATGDIRGGIGAAVTGAGGRTGCCVIGGGGAGTAVAAEGTGGLAALVVGSGGADATADVTTVIAAGGRGALVAIEVCGGAVRTGGAEGGEGTVCGGNGWGTDCCNFGMAGPIFSFSSSGLCHTKNNSTYK